MHYPQFPNKTWRGPSNINIKGRSSDTTVYQSQTEITTINNTPSGTILKSRKWRTLNFLLSLVQSPWTVRIFLFLKSLNRLINRKDRHKRSFKIFQGEIHRLLHTFWPNKGAFFFQNTYVKGSFLCQTQRPQQNQNIVNSMTIFLNPFFYKRKKTHLKTR